MSVFLCSLWPGVPQSASMCQRLWDGGECLFHLPLILRAAEEAERTEHAQPTKLMHELSLEQTRLSERCERREFAEVNHSFSANTMASREAS